MAEKIVGRVEYINQNKGGFYALKIDGTNYGVGKYPPRGIEQGDVVEFEVEYNGNFKNVARGTLRKADASAAPAPEAKKAWGKASSFDDRQDVISKQAALNTALEFLRFAKENETLPVPKTKNQGYGYLKQLWLEEASFLYELNTGKEWDISDAVPVESEAPKPVKKTAKKAAPPPPPVEEEWDDEFDDSDIPF